MPPKKKENNNDNNNILQALFLIQTFHVAGLQLDKPCFLSKSTLGCVVFNVLMYVIFVVHLITTEVTDDKTKVSLSGDWKCCSSIVGLLAEDIDHNSWLTHSAFCDSERLIVIITLQIIVHNLLSNQSLFRNVVGRFSFFLYDLHGKKN